MHCPPPRLSHPHRPPSPPINIRCFHYRLDAFSFLYEDHSEPSVPTPRATLEPLMASFSRTYLIRAGNVCVNGRMMSFDLSIVAVLLMRSLPRPYGFR